MSLVKDQVSIASSGKQQNPFKLKEKPSSSNWLLQKVVFLLQNNLETSIKHSRPCETESFLLLPTAVLCSRSKHIFV